MSSRSVSECRNVRALQQSDIQRKGRPLRPLLVLVGKSSPVRPNDEPRSHAFLQLSLGWKGTCYVLAREAAGEARWPMAATSGGFLVCLDPERASRRQQGVNVAGRQKPRTQLQGYLQ